MALSPVSSATNTTLQISRASETAVALPQSRASSSTTETETGQNSNTTAVNVANSNQASTNARNQTVTRAASLQPNNNSPTSLISNQASQGDVFDALIGAQEQSSSPSNEFADVPEQLGVLFTQDAVTITQENLENFVFSSLDTRSTNSGEDVSALQEIFNEIPEDQVEKFFESFTEFPFAEDDAQETSESETNALGQQTEAAGSFQRGEFQQLQQQIETFQNLGNTPDRDNEVARI